MTRGKIAICHPALREGGGSEARPLWMAEALKQDYDVSLVTMGYVDLDKFNHAYGTHLNRKEITIIELPVPSVFRNRFDALRGYRLSRFCKENSAEYDLMISTYNVMDFGRRGIQFIADFSFDDNLRRKYDFGGDGSENLIYRKSFVRAIYLNIGRFLSKTTQDGWKKNITIANSDWSGQVMKEAFGTESQTIYPPVAGEFPEIPWESKENGFVIMARITPEKRIDYVIEIIRRVREMDNDIHIHILGRLDDSACGLKIKRLAEQNSGWVHLEGLITGQKKADFIARHKYSISGRFNEPFGIAVAEAVKAGCITWVPNGGGQAEIVNHRALLYNSIEDAADKIGKVLGSETMQNVLLKHLASQAKKFTADNFVAEVRHLVKCWFDEL